MDSNQANEFTRQAWNTNAAYWDQRIAEGNDFVNLLIWPAAQRLLEIHPGQRLLDVATGNGLYARRMTALGAQVTAFDFASEMIEIARRRAGAEAIDYRVLDATDEDALLALGEESFDAALCSMALFDMAEIGPLYRALHRLLRPDGRFVFSVMHPAFNNPFMLHSAELEDRDGEIVTRYFIKMTRYLTAGMRKGLALDGQPAPQLYFHRPLELLLSGAFAAGFVLDALEERAFPAGHPHRSSPLTWGGNYSEFPPVLLCRLVKLKSRI